MIVDPGGIWCEAQGSLTPLQLLVEAPYGGKCGRVLWLTLLLGDRCDAGGPAVAQHLKCGGGCSGLPLGITDGRRGCKGQQQCQQSGTAGKTDDQVAQ